MITLNSNWNYLLGSLAQGLNQGVNKGLSAGLEQELYNQRVQKQLETQKKLLGYKQNLENQQLTLKINNLFGYDTPDLQMTEPQPSPNNPIDIQAQQMINPEFQQPVGLTQRFLSMMPQPQLTKRHIDGQLSQNALLGKPTVKDYITAQIYGINLPEVKEKKKKYEAKVVEGNLFTFDPETGQWIKKGEIKKVIKETPQRMLVDTGDKKLLIDKKDGKVIKEYKVNKRISKVLKQDSKLFVRPSDVISQINVMSTKEVIDPLTGQKTKEKRNLTYNDLKKVYKNDIWFKDKNGNTYEVVGVLNNYPVISIGNETYKVVGEKNGEPIVEANINGRTLAVPFSKLEKFKNRYTVRATVQMPKVINENSYKTAEEYLQKWIKQ